MKKIGIATITIEDGSENAYNYGNKLQNYALQTYIKKLGYDVETIRYQSSPSPIPYVGNKQKRDLSILQFGSDCVRIISRRIFQKQIEKKRNRRIELFDDFCKNYISYTNESYNAKTVTPNLGLRYDKVIVGSDMVWNPYYEGSNEFFYLQFADEEKRIAYAPSIGDCEIPKEMQDNYRRWLKNIPYLSAREENGKKEIQKLSGRNVIQVVDPVFLLSKEEWESVMQPISTKQDYFLVYMLGKKDVERKRLIRRLEKKYHMKAIDIYTRDNRKSYFAGPLEFVGAIANASFVCTDSFHGTAFSLILNVPVVTFKRKGSNSSRLLSLFRMLECGNRDVGYILESKENMRMDFESINKKLDVIVKESKVYLNNALVGGN